MILYFIARPPANGQVLNDDILHMMFDDKLLGENTLNFSKFISLKNENY